MKAMPTPLGGIGQQVADNLFELGQNAVKGVAKVGVDIAKDSMEHIVGAPSSVAAKQGDKKPETAQASAAQQQAAQKKQMEKRQYEAVKNEMATYIQRKQQQDAQIARERNQEAQQKEQKNAFEKRKKESFVQQLLHKIGGGSHGETSKQKE